MNSRQPTIFPNEERVPGCATEEGKTDRVDDVWNFAFGSNLDPKKRKGRANLKIEETVPGKLKDWRLAFNLRGISWLEPSMAGVEPALGEEVHGVLLRMCSQEFSKLVLSEGENHSYRQVEVEVETYEGYKIWAIAFQALDDRRLDEDCPPSLRYLELIREGARLSGLDQAYIRKLKSLPHSEKSPGARLVSHLLFDLIMFFGGIGLPQIGTRLYRILRWIDSKSNPAILKLLMNFFLLIPVLPLATFLSLRHIFVRRF